MPEPSPAFSARFALQVFTLCCLATLGACADGPHVVTRYSEPGTAVYRAPGPAGDPWGPYIQSAARRFAIPDEWIRAVIAQESGGHQYLNGQPITSSAGAMGLMQLMPETYAEMQAQFGLGDDPYEPHDNILAGTGYIRILYRKYGAPAFLAAYNAGPRRLEDYLYNGRQLPNETVNYVASITPHLGTRIALSGPLASYADATQPVSTSSPVVEVASASQSARPIEATSCDPDAAYDPTRPCTPAPSQSLSPARPIPVFSNLPPRSYRPCNPDSAYDTQDSCTSQPVAQRPVRTLAPTLVMATLPRRKSTGGDYAVQVGAFSGNDQARFAATMARQTATLQLATSRMILQPVPALGRGSFWRARLGGISRQSAAAACASLQSHNMACMIVPPGH